MRIQRPMAKSFAYIKEELSERTRKGEEGVERGRSRRMIMLRVEEQDDEREEED